VNDSPALAQADVGMSVGVGASDIASEAADMVLVRGDMISVCTAIHLSRAIFRRIQWNFVWSLLYNCLGIPVASGIFYPLTRVRLPPTLAALAMALSSISVVISSLTLRLYRPPDVVEEGHTHHERRRSIQHSARRASLSNNTEQNDQRVGLLLNDHYAASESTSRIDNRSRRSTDDGLSVA
jgi:magnesium-transporting ATPase (P-type)